MKTPLQFWENFPESKKKKPANPHGHWLKTSFINTGKYHRKNFPDFLDFPR
jgi:hypothetical protein